MELFDAEKERNNKLSLQFEEDKENSSKWVLLILPILNIVQYYILYLALGDFRVSLSSVGWP